MKETREAGRFVAVCAASMLCGVTSASMARATELSCGQTVTASVTLEADLTCPLGGLVVGADDVTIDLGGHTLFGPTAIPPAPGSVGIRTLPGLAVKGLRVRNGNFVGFARAITVRNSSDVEVTHVNVRSPVSQGMLFADSSGVRVSTVTIIGALPYDRETQGILLNRVAEAQIRNILVRGFSIGVSFQCPTCVADERPNSGDVKDSAFADGGPFAVALDYASNVTVAGNHIWGFWTADGGGGGIGGGFGGGVNDLRIVDNTITFSNRGLVFDNLTASTISANTLLDNQWGGVVLGYGCTGNRITSNIALDNGAGADLFHRENSSPNVWAENICRTTYGADARCEPQAP